MKKFVALLLCLTLICTVSITTTGCNKPKPAEPTNVEKPAEPEKAPDAKEGEPAEKAPDAPKDAPK